ncbi:hypothetical protein [Lichenibacterium dinghuense]|uniref:hypothetical protein n=1 Tax=Lichenibacterium dinghuense TaxID=2895977 RepID=UPI001F448156|nr:hypothetical protein [Lichenibacterium sp. 6Y81]
MMVQAVEGLVGLAVTALALADIFCTILIPGPVKGPFRIAIRLRDLGLPLWRGLSRLRAGGRRQRLSNVFAPLVFFLAFGTWSVLLLLGFALMFHAAAASFRPALDGFDQALYVAGSSLLTLGVSEVDAKGGARWLILWAALSGFGMITATFTYILQIQNSLHQRESGVLTLAGLAGKPPSGIGLLESFAALGLRDDLPDFFKDWRDLSAAVLHSHMSFPVLVYFHSVDAESDWLSALHAVLDAATIVMELTEEMSTGKAALLHRAGSRTVSHLCALFDLGLDAADAPADEDVAAVIERLLAAGYRAKRLTGPETARFLKLRGDYSGRLDALAAHLGAERTRLIPG